MPLTRFKQLFLWLIVGILALGCDSEIKSTAVEPLSVSIAPGTDPNDALNPHNHRSSIIPFSIQATSAAAEGEYRLALRADSQTAPTAAELRSATASIARNISTTAINVFLAFQMDTTLFDSGTAWTDVDGNVALTYAMVNAAILQPSTAYKLYAVAVSGSDEVYTLLTHSTDAEPPLTLVTNKDANGVLMHNIPIGQTYTMRKGEPLIYPARGVNMIDSILITTSLYKTSGTEKTQTLMIRSGSALPSISADDNSLFFAVDVSGNIGSGAMVSKTAFSNTGSLVSGMSFNVSAVLKTNTVTSNFIAE